MDGQIVLRKSLIVKTLEHYIDDFFGKIAAAAAPSVVVNAQPLQGYSRLTGSVKVPVDAQRSEMKRVGRLYRLERGAFLWQTILCEGRSRVGFLPQELQQEEADAKSKRKRGLAIMLDEEDQNGTEG